MSAASSILAVHPHQICSSRLVCNNSTTNRRRLQLRLHGHYKRRRRRQGQQAARAMAGKKEEEEAVVYRGDKLILRGLRFHGTHGVKPEEKKLGQKFVIDVDAWMDLAAAGDSDNISDTVSYTEIYRIAKTVVEGPSHNLLESVAQSIANSTLLKFPQISAVRVKVEKPHVAVQGVLDCLGVQIFRERKA